jgi:hypothetical protein
MIPLEKQVYSLELAKRLKELGVRQESLYYWSMCKDGIGIIKLIDSDRKREKIGTVEIENISAFTVAELGEMLPHGFRSGKAGNSKVGFKAYSSHANGPGGFHEQFDADTEADCRAKMLIYLVENGLLTEV